MPGQPPLSERKKKIYSLKAIGMFAWHIQKPTGDQIDQKGRKAL